MQKMVFAMALCALVALAGCNPGAKGVGDPYESSGTGGEGAGATGTSGGEPADNPGAETPSSK